MFPILTKLTGFIPPEILHKIFINYLKLGISKFNHNSELLKICLWNKEFINPLGLAAGFDKNAEVIKECLNLGFGFVELGTVTINPQSGNQKPRVFKIPEFEAIIQRLGFNNKGIKNYMKNISQFRKKNNHNSIIGSNIGKNKNAEDYLEEYINLLKYCSDFSDYIVINISSPNTPGLRELLKKENLNFFLKKLNDNRINSTPLLLKISPDISSGDLENICSISEKKEWLDGLIISNTTINRDMLSKKPIIDSWKINELWGLSGPPLYKKSNEILKKTYQLTKGKVPIIGVGGISSAYDAYEKISLGASLIQIYTALVYKGPNIISDIILGLEKLLNQNGFKDIKAAIGHKVKI